MAKALTIVGLGGSLARSSKSRAALRVALEGASDADADTTLLDLRELALPTYNPDDDEPTENAARLIETCYAADGMLWSSPMYQGTISGAFKNALDWLHLLGKRDPPYLHDEVIGLISAAGGTQGLQAINTMEYATRASRAWAVPYVVPVAAAWRVFDSNGNVQDSSVESQLRTLGAEVVRVAARFAADHSIAGPSATRRRNGSPPDPLDGGALVCKIPLAKSLWALGFAGTRHLRGEFPAAGTRIGCRVGWVTPPLQEAPRRT